MDSHVYYVPFFDLKDAILGMIFTIHNILIYRTKKFLTCETVPLSVKPRLHPGCESPHFPLLVTVRVY